MIDLTRLQTLGPAAVILAAVLFALTLVTAEPVAAAERTALELEAQKEFERGIQAEQAQELAKARAHYLAAYEKVANGRAAANLGFVEAKLEMWPEAAEHLSAALDHGVPEAARMEVTAVLERVLQRVGVVEVTVLPDTAIVEVDDQLLERREGKRVIYTEPGRHKVRATHQGYAPAELVVTVEAGLRSRVHLLLPEQSTSDLTTQTEPVSDARRHTRGPMKPEVAALVSGSTLTATALVVGTGYALSARQARLDAQGIRDTFPPDPYDSYCYQNDEPNCVKLSELVDKQTRRERAAVWGFVAAGGLAAATVASSLLIRSVRKNREHKTVELHVGPSSASAVVVF